MTLPLPAIASLFDDAKIMAAAYDMLAGSSALMPPVPRDFPAPAGFAFTDWLVARATLGWISEATFSGMVLSGETEDIVIILGTHTLIQWGKDAEAVPTFWTTLDNASGFVSKGFLDVYTGITLAQSASSLRGFIARSSLQGRTIRILGHSLGAAVGGLVAADSAKPKLRLFAMPKFSDLTLSKHVAAKMLPDSIVARNVQDIVPMMPPFPIYQSVLPEAWFNSDIVGVAGEDAARHSMRDCYLRATVTAALASQSPAA